MSYYATRMYCATKGGRKVVSTATLIAYLTTVSMTLDVLAIREWAKYIHLELTDLM